jgi:PAS domain S-box-containing protein
VGATSGETYFAFVMVVILAVGWTGTEVAGVRGAEEARARLGHESDIITSAIDPMRLTGLTLTSADLIDPDYLRLREQLVMMAESSPDVSRITLTMERDGRVHFVADILPKSLSASVQPGELYGEHPREIRTVRVTGVRTIAGPYTDRRGTFLSGFSAIRDPASEEVLGVLGVDWDFARYSLAISRNRLIPLSLMIVACLSVLAYQLYRQRDREVARRLAAGERSMRLAQAISRVGSWTRDLRTGRFEWSAEMFTIFGVDPGRGTPTREEQRAFLSERDWEREREAEERAERNGVGFEVDFRIVRPDGGVRYVVSRGEPARDQRGRVVGVAGIIQDLTVRHEAQAQVEMLKKRMEFILGAARTGLDIIDSSYDVRYVDPGWQKVYGDPAGRKCHEYFMGRATPCDGCGIRRALAEKTISVTEEILPKEDNRPIQVTTIPFQSEEGEWLVAEVNVDITERKRIEEGNARLAALVESSEDAIVGLGMDRTITVWNQGAQRVYGYSAAEIIGHQSSMLIPPDREDEAKAMRERLERGERIERYETTRRRKDGTQINVALTLSTIRDPQGKPIGMASVARDITADKAIQAQLIRAQRLESLGTLAAGIAHQFNNINAVIKGYLQILEMSELQDPALTYVQEALKGVQRAVDITDRLLGFTNVSRNEGETSRLEDVARSILPLLAEKYKEAGVLLRDELVTTPAVKAGVSLVCFIITGLLSNALHAVLDMPVRIVTIRTGMLPGHSFLEVSDTGCGMSIEDVRRVFTPFFTTKGEWAAEGSAQSKNRGIGLTLAVSQATAAAQGGRIEIQSAPGQGSAFRLLLPVAPQNPVGAR